jgi:hypothetical protein
MDSSGIPANRSWFRISLRAALILLTLACIWLAVVFNRVRRQERAVKAIEETGGLVAFDYQFAPEWKQSDPPPGPGWLRRIVGDDFFRAPQHVDLRGEQITDGFLEVHLAGLSSIQLLSIENSTQVTDAGIARVARLQKVNMLSLAVPNLTDAALADIGRMRQLTALSIDSPLVSDVGLSRLAGLDKLEALTLQCPQITPAGIRRLTEFDRIRYAHSIRDSNNMAVLDKLRTATDLEMMDVPLVDAIEFLAATMEVPFDLQGVSVATRSAPITATASNQPLEAVLALVLEPLGFGFSFDAGTIKIAPRERAKAMRPGYWAFRETFQSAERIEVDW